MARAEQDALALTTGGVDGLLIENTESPLWPENACPSAALVASLTIITRRVQHLSGLPVGLSVGYNHPETAAAIACVVGADFIRVPVLLGTRLSVHGLMNSKWLAIQDILRTMKVSTVQLWADVSPDHCLPEGVERMPAQALITRQNSPLMSNQPVIWEGGLGWPDWADALLLTAEAVQVPTRPGRVDLGRVEALTTAWYHPTAC